jgi:hypothetical protein
MRLFELPDVSTKKKRKYHCLSYTWGSPFPPSKKPPPIPLLRDSSKHPCQPPEYAVMCDGQPIPISYNLWAALVHLYKQRRPELGAI